MAVVIRESPERTRSKIKPIRYVKVLASVDGQFYYVVTDRKGEPVYTSETFVRKNGAITAARREHAGRTNFEYVLVYTDDRRRTEVKETLN